MKRLSFILLICFTGLTVFSQEQIEVKYQKDSAIPMNVVKVNKIKTLDLTHQQKKEVKKYHKAQKIKIALIKKNTSLTTTQKKDQMEQMKKEKYDKLEAILTPEQKEKIKQNKIDTPRRGVTNMPNERTAKK